MILLQGCEVHFSNREYFPQGPCVLCTQEYEDFESMPLWSEETAQCIGIFIYFLPQLFQFLPGLVVDVQYNGMGVPCNAVCLPFLPVPCRYGIEWQLLLHMVRLLYLSLADEQPDFEYELCMQSFCNVLNHFAESNFSPDVAESAVSGNRNIFHF